MAVTQSLLTATIEASIRELASDAITSSNGYEYVDGSLLSHAISPICARAFRVGSVIRDGLVTNVEFVLAVDPEKVTEVTVQMQNNIGAHTRTIGTGGTTGNSGLINMAPDIIPSTTPFSIPLRQLDDAQLFFPKLTLKTMLFDVITVTIANFIQNVINVRDAYAIASAIAMNAHRNAGETAGSESNIVRIVTANTSDTGYYVGLVGELNSLMENGDTQNNLATFVGPRDLVARPSFIESLRNPKSGYVVTGSDISANLLREPMFDIKKAMEYSDQYRGDWASRYGLMSAPQSIWTYVEKWLGLATGALDGVMAVCFNAQAYANGGAMKEEVVLLQSSVHSGVVAQPYIKWGGAAYRNMFMITTSDFVVPTALQLTDAPMTLVAPADWDNTVQTITQDVTDTSGAVVGTIDIAQVIVNPDSNSIVSLSVTNSATGALLSTATVTSTTADTQIVSGGNGNFLIVAPFGKALSFTVANTGYTSQTISLTAKQMSNLQVVQTVALVTS